MSLIYLAPIGPLDPDLLQALSPFLEDHIGATVRWVDALNPPPSAYDAARRQYNSVEFLKTLAAAYPPSAHRFVGFTSLDLCIPMLTFVFGQAQFEGRLALVSTARLEPRFYGMPSDPLLLRQRAAKELLHELGHTYGLVHCLDQTCAMSLSTSIQHVDRKRDEYCGDCAALLWEPNTSTSGTNDENPLEHLNRR